MTILDKVFKLIVKYNLSMAEKLAKICISVDPDLLVWIDGQIKKRVYRNRSHAFDVAGNQLREELEEDASPKEATVKVAA